MIKFLKNKKKIILFLVLASFFAGSDFAHAEVGLASLIGDGFAWLIRPLLDVIFGLVGWFFQAAALLFAWIVDPVNIKAIINNEVVYEVWTTVRDITNMFFILVLLFSAFATIFQISKYNIRNIILTLVIMALLVNFSFPIAIAIIDISNVIMYELLNNMFIGNPQNFGATIGELSGLTKTLTPELEGNGNVYVIVAIIFMFLLTITLMVIGVLLTIRTVVLAILVMLSPVGFVGNIFPGFQKYADDWWNSLFKYAFGGPIMIFFVAMSLYMMQSIKKYDTLTNNFQKIATDNSISSSQANFFASTVFMMIPIIMLWMGIGAAQKSGIAGGAAVGKWGQNMAKKFSGYNWGKKNYDQFKSARKARQDEIDKKRFGGTLGRGLNKWQDTVISKMPIGGGAAAKRVEKTRQADAIKDVKDKSEDLKGAQIGSLSTTINNTFDAAGNLTSSVTKDQAGAAQAFMNKQGDDRKTFVEDDIQNNGMRNVSKILAGAPANISAAVATVQAGTAAPGYQDALRQVTSYINRRSEEVVTKYTA